MRRPTPNILKAHSWTTGEGEFRCRPVHAGVFEIRNEGPESPDRHFRNIDSPGVCLDEIASALRVHSCQSLCCG